MNDSVKIIHIFKVELKNNIEFFVLSSWVYWGPNKMHKRQSYEMLDNAVRLYPVY